MTDIPTTPDQKPSPLVGIESHIKTVHTDHTSKPVLLDDQQTEALEIRPKKLLVGQHPQWRKKEAVYYPTEDKIRLSSKLSAVAHAYGSRDIPYAIVVHLGCNGQRGLMCIEVWIDKSTSSLPKRKEAHEAFFSAPHIQAAELAEA